MAQTPRRILVEVASDGREALRRVKAAPPDLVLSDGTIGGLNRLDLCPHLKADPATRLVPVVRITGIGDERKTEGVEAGPGTRR